MGKKSRQRMTELDEEIRIKLRTVNCIPNLNPDSSELRDIQKEQLKEIKIRQIKTKMLRGYRRVLKEMGEHERKHRVVKIFGFWKYWLLNGVIGPDEES